MMLKLLMNKIGPSFLQSFKLIIITYTGTAFAAITALVLIPLTFTNNTEYWSVAQLLLADLAIFSVFSQFSTNNAFIKFYPLLKEKEEREGFIAFLINVLLLGIVLSMLAYYVTFFEGPLSSKNELFGEFQWLFFPLLVLNTLSAFIFSYSRVISKAVVPTFIRETGLRIWSMITILLLYLEVIDLTSFVYIYFLQYVFYLLSYVIYIYRVKRDKILFKLVSFKRYKKQIKYLLFTLISGASAILVLRIDVKMIDFLHEFESIAIYSLGMYLFSMIQIPTRSISTVVLPILSDKFQNEHKEKFVAYYLKVSLSYFFLTAILFLAIFIVLDEIMLILGEKFGQIKYVFIFLGVGKVIESIGLVNYPIISISKVYTKDYLFQLIVLVTIVLFNVILIPAFGINGAALATCMSFILGGLIRGIFVYKKLHITPFFKELYFLIPLLLLFSCISLISVGNHYVSILIKESIFAVLVLILITKGGLLKKIVL